MIEMLYVKMYAVQMFGKRKKEKYVERQNPQPEDAEGIDSGTGSRKLHIFPSSYARLESGETHLTPEKLEKLANVRYRYAGTDKQQQRFPFGIRQQRSLTVEPCANADRLLPYSKFITTAMIR